MTCRPHCVCRAGFSLLEIIIATAILAASAMVLTSLLGLGTRFGNRAEERTVALSQAHSLLDEFLAMPSQDRSLEQETRGELSGPPPRTFRISLSTFATLGSESSPDASARVASPSDNFNAFGSSTSGSTAEVGKLVRVSVEIFEAAGDASSREAEPLCRLSRVVRAHRLRTPVVSNAPFEAGFSGGSP